MKHKQFTAPVAHFKVLNEELGISEQIVSVFNNKDHAGDRVLPGFFKESLARKLPKGVWMHDWQRPVAKTLEARELLPGDELLPDSIKSLGGLYIKGQYNLDTQDGREMFSHLKFGSVDEFSFGYDVEAEKYNTKDRCNDLIKGTIYEWSPVLVGCNPATALVGVKTAEGPEGVKAMFSREKLKERIARAKGQYLGPYAEAEATFSAIYDLWYSFWYGPLCDALYGDGDNDEDDTDPIGYLSAAFDEFRDISLAIASAMRAALGENEEGDVADDLMVEMSSLVPERSSIKTTTNDSDAPSPRAGGAYSKQLQAALAAVEGCIERGKSIAAIRAKDGRALSQERREQLLTLAKALTDMAAEPAAEKTEKTETAPASDLLQAYLAESAEMERVLLPS